MSEIYAHIRNGTPNKINKGSVIMFKGMPIRKPTIANIYPQKWSPYLVVIPCNNAPKIYGVTKNNAIGASIINKSVLATTFKKILILLVLYPSPYLYPVHANGFKGL